MIKSWNTDNVEIALRDVSDPGFIFTIQLVLATRGFTCHSSWLSLLLIRLFFTFMHLCYTF